MVRRILPGETGPTGGPAMTDVLGTCLSWDDGVCVVQPDGPDAAGPVHIAIADIVSGKPVPPRPSPRLRIEPQDAQVRALALWPDLETRAARLVVAAPVRGVDGAAGQLGAGDDAVRGRWRLRGGGRVLRGARPAADRRRPPRLRRGRDVPLARLGAREPRRGHRLRDRRRGPGPALAHRRAADRRRRAARGRRPPGHRARHAPTTAGSSPPASRPPAGRATTGSASAASRWTPPSAAGAWRCW